MSRWASALWQAVPGSIGQRGHGYAVGGKLVLEVSPDSCVMITSCTRSRRLSFDQQAICEPGPLIFE